jgi:hypothetical protein
MQPMLRIRASEGRVTLSCGEIGGGCEGTVERAGVCFLRHSKLKKLIQTCHADAGHSTTIEIEVTPVGIRVGRSEVSRAGWEISLFAKSPHPPRRRSAFASRLFQRNHPKWTCKCNSPCFPLALTMPH